MKLTIGTWLFSILVFSITGNLNAQASDEHHLIQVNGAAEKTVEPNIVVVQIESWAKASSAKKAQEIQATQFATFKRSIEKYRIKKEDIQTQSFYVNPDYIYDPKTRTNKVQGYRVSHSVSITYRKIEDAGNFLDDIVTSNSDTSGINVSGISWDYDRKDQVELSALGDAVRNAKLRADELAAAAKVKISGVHKIQHTSYTAPAPQPYMAKAAMMEMSSVAAPTELSGGQIKISVQVTVEYEIN